MRLVKARKAGSMTKEQEAALDNLAQPSGASQLAAEQLVDEIIQLGHMPQQSTKTQALRRNVSGCRWSRHARRAR